METASVRSAKINEILFHMQNMASLGASVESLAHYHTAESDQGNGSTTKRSGCDEEKCKC